MTVKFKRRSFIQSAFASIPTLLLWPRKALSQVIPFAYWKTQNTSGGPQHTLWIWGVNSYNWLPSTATYPTTMMGSSPIQLPGSWLQVSASGGSAEPLTPPGYTLAIRADGTLWGWGDNNFGQLGQGNYIPVPSSSVQIPGSWTQVSAGGMGTDWYVLFPFAMGIQTDGTLWAWGDNTYGQLAQNSLATVNYPSPIQLAGTWNAVVACGQFWAGIQSNGTLWACGQNGSGQMGLANFNSAYSSPVQVCSGTNWTKLSIAYDTSAGGTGGTIYAINSLGQLWGCGSNFYGELLHATTTQYISSPIQIAGSWTQVSTGGLNYALALQSGGKLFSWGLGTSGELGNNAATSRSSPVQIAGSWSQVASGVYDNGSTGVTNNCSLAINSQGQLFGWGANYTGAKVSSPVQISGSWSQIFSGVASNFGTKAGSTLWGWGNGSWGNVIPGSNGWPLATDLMFSSPVQISGSWLQVSGAGTTCFPNNWNFALGIRTDYTLWGWGANAAGQLAQSSLSLFRSPVQIPGSWAQICARASSFGIRMDGTLWSWGDNTTGELGIGTTTPMSSPVQVSGGGSWIQVTATETVFGIKTDGTLWGWGANDGGQLGTLADPTLTPTQIFTGQGSFTQVTTGDDQTSGWGIPVLAINTQSQLWAMGINGNGELGVNTTTMNYSSPMQVHGSWSQVATSFNGHTVAIQSNGTLWAWGLNNFGQCAKATTTTAFSSPVQVSSLNWTQCWAGAGSSYAIRSDNTLWVWGDVSDSGNLGIGNAVHYSSPVQIAGTWYHITSADTGNDSGQSGGEYRLGIR